MTENPDAVTSFVDMFPVAPGSDRAKAREIRMEKERRAQLSDKQLKRGGVRTAQINFRCSPEFIETTKQMQALLGKGTSIADVLEQALELYAQTKGLRGKER